METNTEYTTTELVQQFLRFLTERKLDDLTKLFSENVDWYIPGDESKAKWLGKRNSRQEVAEFYNLLWKSTEPVSAKIDNIFTEKEDAVIVGEFSTKMLATNKIVDSLFSIQLHIQDNKITKYRLLEDSYAVSKSLTI